MKKILAVLFVVLLILQVFQIDKVNPPINKGTDFLTIKETPPVIATIIRNSCYDCHSNETEYPWYSYTQPAGWFLKSHIDEGRRKLNFSTFATYEPKRQAHKLDECIELVEKEAMPLDSYTIIHQKAALTPEQRKTLIDYFKRIKEDTERKEAL